MYSLRGATREELFDSPILSKTKWQARKKEKLEKNMERKEKKKKKEVDSWPGLIGLVKLTWRKLNALGNYLQIPMDMAEGMVWGSVTSSPSQFLTRAVQSRKFISARHKRVNQRQSWVAEGQRVERTPPESFLTVGKRDELVVGPWALEVEISELSDQAGLCFFLVQPGVIHVTGGSSAWNWDFRAVLVHESAKTNPPPFPLIAPDSLSSSGSNRVPCLSSFPNTHSDVPIIIIIIIKH